MRMMVAAAVTSLREVILTQRLSYTGVQETEVGQASVLLTVAQQFSSGIGVTLSVGLLQLSAGGTSLTVSDFRMPFWVTAGSAIATSGVQLGPMSRSLNTTLNPSRWGSSR
ncbi:hypothetical protein [Bradyrhizobium erythrophlei]|uniref:hypothetical protein n=1 Tax=Bradyrhizobium erythrophlei TaxID=1437360 RepID=UPI000B84CC24|nr:hypothetical protein [Bradyrhizobium erythrophlei]